MPPVFAAPELAEARSTADDSGGGNLRAPLCLVDPATNANAVVAGRARLHAAIAISANMNAHSRVVRCADKVNKKLPCALRHYNRFESVTARKLISVDIFLAF